jgi:Uma2 family endonuclease
MNVSLTRAAEGLARRAFTVADLERMASDGIVAPDERLEMIGGEIVPMSPKGARHEAIKIALNLFWGRRCPPNYAFAPETGLRLDERTYLEPDFIVFERKLGLTDIKGADVLLAVEIGDSSLRYDLDRKPLIYSAFGVCELWVIDAEARIVHVHGDPGPTGYRRIEQRRGGDVVTPTVAPEAFAFVLDQLEGL